MKLKFKKQAYQSEAVAAIVDCFAGQPNTTGILYRIDPGKQSQIKLEESGFRNNEILLSDLQLLENIHAVQRGQNLPLSSCLENDVKTGCHINLTVEMETGTGKTYCYIKTMFELNTRFGWSKFIIIVPSIAIREGVYQAINMTASHFMEDYKKQVRAFIYDSKQLHKLESFSSDNGINVMIINVQAFNAIGSATGKDNRRIYEALDDFQSRRPIDVISANHPILILDEPQKMEGDKTLESLKKFKPLMILRYSATHKTHYNKVYRLDALDAYNQKLVKKIAVRGIAVKNLTGTQAYLYLTAIEVFPNNPPIAKVELEIKQANGIKRVLRTLHKNDDLHEISKLDQYKGFVLADINAHTNTISFTNGVELQTGEVTGDISESTLRRIQIREAIKAHFEKEQVLFQQGVKVLTLFFIDSVVKYRNYNENGEQAGEYAQIFEEEYKLALENINARESTPYYHYLQNITAQQTHHGYFSIDKKSKHLINPITGKRSNEADDVDAYDLILKDKERLLSLSEPVRFIFSHSALREGWDNPNVFVICTLKHSDNTISRRQEVGRGMRIAVNQNGDRLDNPATVHQINVLTVVASESYTDFVIALQRDMSEVLSARPHSANEAYFLGKILATGNNEVAITPQMAKQIVRYLSKNDYIDLNDKITATYHDAKKAGSLVPLPTELAAYATPLFQLIDNVVSDKQVLEVINERNTKIKDLLPNANFEKQEFKALWNRINRKAVYTVEFNTEELIKKCIAALNQNLRVNSMHYVIQGGEQKNVVTYEEITQGDGFEVRDTTTNPYVTSIRSNIKYDLIGKIADAAKLTRATIGAILQGIHSSIFNQYQINPEGFIATTARLINEQKATIIVEHIAYDALNETYNLDIFTQKKSYDVTQVSEKLNHHIFDYVFTDSKTEHAFVKELDTSTEVAVYAKLPAGFSIPTPVGDYTPDWAIAFKEGSVKHIYFVAETKGNMDSMHLRNIEEAKASCAKKFFSKISSNQVKYAIVSSYGELMNIVCN